MQRFKSSRRESALKWDPLTNWAHTIDVALGTVFGGGSHAGQLRNDSAFDQRGGR
jgi:hypothetical protein